MIFENATLFFISIVIVIKSAGYATKYIIDIAKHLRLSEFFVTFVIAGVISIMPELFIGINSAIAGSSAIGIGTLIGSNIADLTLVIGIIALAGKKIMVNSSITRNNNAFLAVTALPVLFMLDGQLSRDDGIILVVAFLFYMSQLIKKEKIFSKHDSKDVISALKSMMFFIACLAVLFVSAHFVVESVVGISHELLIPSVVIGMFLVAFGTTMPEMAFSLKAVLAKHKDIALGNVLGNVAADCTLSMGIVAIIAPVETAFSAFATSMLFMVFSALLVVTLLQDGKKITSNDSFLLFFLYIVFALIELRHYFT
ncbi:MAG: sodium:calcium antiporter [Candidatus Aenigmarchaeota archaeon]|nr:sodium:calcium antiporter [Candidatus Aenigmarchaeota archaeon]